MACTGARFTVWYIVDQTIGEPGWVLCVSNIPDPHFLVYRE